MHVPSIICKHRNEEGGLGFHAFKNATVGGDWIIQESLTNAPWLAKVNRLISVLLSCTVLYVCLCVCVVCVVCVCSHIYIHRAE
jgi:hypothetical protein